MGRGNLSSIIHFKIDLKSAEGKAAFLNLAKGADALIEITKLRTGCERLEAAQGRSNEAFGGLVGWMARVVHGGMIQVGDGVEKVIKDYAD